MKKGILAVLSVLALTGCAQKTATEPAAATTGEARKPVSAEAKPVHPIKDEGDGKYYIMMEQHERLCSDCDR